MATIATVGGIGEKIELLISQGDDFGPHEVTLQNTDGTPFDLTGATLVGGVKKEITSTELAALFSFEYVNRPGGVFKFSIGKFTTERMSASLDLNGADGLHVYDIKLSDAAGRRQKIYYGPARVHASVSI